ncbi:MAG: hypothetical protein MUP70_05390 [Candidatus Aminicenantes bacterium]|nr:hypothetical protein [Candidatus Aminicenantes bacterium]
MTSEMERIKILEGKISHVVSYVQSVLAENEKLKKTIGELQSNFKTMESKAGEAEKLDQNLKKYEKEREVLKEKIETIIGQIDQLGI